MSNIVNQELAFSDKTNAIDSFRDISLDFGKIENIQKDTEMEFDKIVTNYQSEIIKLLCVVDINQILSDPEYTSKILLRQIQKILTFEEFKLYFKLDKKNKKIKNKNEVNNIQTLENSNYNIDQFEKINITNNNQDEKELQLMKLGKLKEKEQMEEGKINKEKKIAGLNEKHDKDNSDENTNSNIDNDKKQEEEKKINMNMRSKMKIKIKRIQFKKI